uniref:Putative fuseless n=1 Tax=Corethrella appendiculata TaxID=1370023 RepID=U5ESC6_9DIPT
MRGSTAGVADNIINPKMSFHNILLELLDTFYGSLIIAPLVVGYWRGTWNLSGIYLYPSNQTISCIYSLSIGIIGHLFFTLFQNSFTHYFNPDKNRLIFYIISRLYTIIYGAICVNTWRGGWQLIDLYLSTNITITIVITFTCTILLALIKGIRNLAATPFVICCDTRQDYFLIPTYFKKTGSRDPALYVLDCIFSVLVIGSLVVFVWRGLWVLLDLLLFPEEPSLSAFGSLFIGYGIVGVTFSLQPLMRYACDRLEGFWRVAVADIFLFLSFVGTVNVWRGVWWLLDIYFIPENKVLSDWITHGVSLAFLILLNCSNSVLVRGVYIDAEEPAGQCVVFPVYYIRLFFQKERTKKQKRLLETLEKQEQNNTTTVLLIDKTTSISTPIISNKNSKNSNNNNNNSSNNNNNNNSNLINTKSNFKTYEEVPLNKTTNECILVKNIDEHCDHTAF